MSEAKKYYWLKLKADFFSSKRIKKLRKMAGGDTYTIIYLKMQLASIKTDGVLQWTGLEDNFAAELALDLDESVEDVQMTLLFLQANGLIETSDNVNYILPYAVENTGTETSAAERMRRMRERKTDGTEKLPAKTNAERQSAFRAKKNCEKQHIPYIEDYQNKKRYNGYYYLVCQREKFRCAICGSTENLCVHHIDGFDEKKPENSEYNKMILLCRECHKNVHDSNIQIPEEILDSIGYSNVTESVTPLLHPRYTEIEKEKEKEIKKELELDPCRPDVQQVIDAWNSLGLQKVTRIVTDSQRGKRLRKRISDYGLAEVLRAIDMIRVSSFLQGKNSNGWQITFDWFVRPNNFPKVLEGNYTDKKPSGYDTNNIFLQMMEDERDKQ